MLPYNFKFLWAPFLDRYRLAVPRVAGAAGCWRSCWPPRAACSCWARATRAPRAPRRDAGVRRGVSGRELRRRQRCLQDRRACVPKSARPGTRRTRSAGGSRCCSPVRWRWCCPNGCRGDVVYTGLGCMLIVGVLCTLAGPEPETGRGGAAHVSEGRHRAVHRLLSAPAFGGRAGLHAVLQLRRHDRVEDAVPVLPAEGWLSSLRARHHQQAHGDRGHHRRRPGHRRRPRPSLGFRKSVWVFGAAAAASNLLYILLAEYGKNRGLLVLAVGVDNFFGGMRSTLMLAFLTGITNPRFSATQYALFSSATSVLGRHRRGVVGPRHRRNRLERLFRADQRAGAAGAGDLRVRPGVVFADLGARR